MAWQVQYLPDQEIILVENSGDLTHQDFKDQSRDVAVLSEATQVFRILSDNTEMHTRIGTADIYEFPKIYREAGLSARSKIAVLISAEDTRIDDFKFYETVCLNRGYQSRIFFDDELALGWLRGEYQISAGCSPEYESRNMIDESNLIKMFLESCLRVNEEVL